MKKWTKEELRLRDGVVELSSAVVKQWLLDGMPESSRDGIRPWLAILQDAQKEHDYKLRAPTLSLEV